MIAIAESGSTKTEWIILDEKSGEIIKSIRTAGFNPDFHSSEHITTTLNQSADISKIKEEVKTVYFYGAGCSNVILNAIVSDALELVFTKASITVDHDLLAAACSVYDGNEIICGILGTGSNSCYYDGQKIFEELPSLGFIAGDEGSGGSIGKRFLADYFYKKLPKEINDDFKSTYKLTWAMARKEIYGSNHPNVYCASFMPFIAKYKETDYVKGIIRAEMKMFIDAHVKCFVNYSSNKVGFVGSIAYYFQDILKEELEKESFEFVHVIKNPAMNLVDYHRKYKINLATSQETVNNESNI